MSLILPARHRLLEVKPKSADAVQLTWLDFRQIAEQSPCIGVNERLWKNTKWPVFVPMGL
jgi:hypothetical protein